MGRETSGYVRSPRGNIRGDESRRRRGCDVTILSRRIRGDADAALPRRRRRGPRSSRAAQVDGANVSRHLICAICHGVLENPVQTRPRAGAGSASGARPAVAAAPRPISPTARALQERRRLRAPVLRGGVDRVALPQEQLSGVRGRDRSGGHRTRAEFATYVKRTAPAGPTLQTSAELALVSPDEVSTPQVRAPRAIVGLIDDLECYCDHAALGCEWTGCRDALDRHADRCDSRGRDPNRAAPSRCAAWGEVPEHAGDVVWRHSGMSRRFRPAPAQATPRRAPSS